MTLPEGVSPDNQDVAYLPGSVYSRPCLQKIYASAFPSGGPSSQVPTVVYGKTFTTSAGVVKNMYLDSNGYFWVEDWTNSPGTYTNLFQTTPGSMCQSITAFGREYIAISDGLHGTDVAYQWDGTYLDRVTQDGPGAPPIVSCFSLPSATLTNASTTGLTISSIQAISPYVVGGTTYYAALFVQLSSFTGLITPGTSVTISGNGVSAYNISGAVTGYGSSSTGTDFTIPYNLTTSGLGTGGTATVGGLALVRSNNVVTGTTSTAHGLQVGYQVQISNATTSVVGTAISKIVINNENQAGIATVTTSTVHGLIPGNFVTITGITPNQVGSGIVTAIRYGDIVTLTTTAAHGLVPGAVIVVAGVTDVTFAGTFTVQSIPSPTAIVYQQTDTDSSSSGGTVSISWPIPSNTPTPTYFNVLSVPTPTTFQVQVIYANGTWSTGLSAAVASYRWNGIYYVTAVLSTTSFQYNDYGPSVGYSAAGTETATPYGQIGPGLHLCRQSFLTRQGTITEPSPYTTFVSNGGQYVSVSQMATGPSNVVARILEFTGAQPNVPGTLPPFFYIPSIPQTEGLIVGTSTQINDNSTGNVVLDFSDNTLFAGTSTSIPGNNTTNQIVIDGALSFGYFDSRLTTWGQRNAIQNLNCMHFGGGINSFGGNPLGWTVPTSSVHGNYVIPLSSAVRNGYWQIAAQSTDVAGTAGLIQQPGFVDVYGNPILDSNTLYKVRFFVVPGVAASNLTLTFFISSASTSFATTATFALATLTAWQLTNQAYCEAVFSLRTPLTIPTDMIFGMYGTSAIGTATANISELSLINSLQPYLDRQAYTSYDNNPTAFDGVSGVLEPTEDTKKIMGFTVLRGTPYMHTQDPSGRLHEIQINPTSEPIGWNIREIGTNCGVLSAFCMTHSQADDATGAGAEDWTAWASEGGAMIFDGSEPRKVSQEIQPNWYEPFLSSTVQINMAAATTVQALNDPIERIIYFFLPIGSATAPNQIYPLSYRELNSGAAIVGSPPFHPSLAGRLVATDNTRKWTHWNLAINGAARMVQSSGKLTTVFFGGNGQIPGAVAGYGNVYTLNPTLLTDADYGQVYPYYVTHFFVDTEKAQALQLTAGRLILAYLTAYVSGTGNITATYLCDRLGNPWALTTTRTLSSTPNFDLEFGGGMAQGNRIAIKLATSPVTGTDNGFNLQRLIPFFRAAKMKNRGSAS